LDSKGGGLSPTGRLYEIEFVHIWSVRDEKISEFWVYTDTAALVEALRPLRRPLLNDDHSILNA
jgi:ketosteroid isomerase-like protein